MDEIAGKFTEIDEKWREAVVIDSSLTKIKICSL